MIPYYIFTVQVLVSVVHEQPIFFAIGPSSQVCPPCYRKVVDGNVTLESRLRDRHTSVSVPENDLESDLVKLNANDSAYYCSISNILRYNYP